MPRSSRSNSSASGSSYVATRHPSRTPTNVRRPAAPPRGISSTSSSEGAQSIPPPYLRPASQQVGQSSPPPPEPVEITSIWRFDPTDGDVVISLRGELLATHKYLLRQFAKFNEMLESQLLQTIGARPWIPLEDTTKAEGEDFHRAFAILYASPLHGPFEFSTETFESALRLATLFEYPELRSYAIDHLERIGLDPIKAIQLSRECCVPDWEEPARTALVEREEMPNHEECDILGMEAFRDIAMRREERKVQTRRPSQNVKSKPTSTPLQSSETMASGGISVADIQDQIRRTSMSPNERKDKSRTFPTKPCFFNARTDLNLEPAQADTLDMVEILVRDCRCKVLVNWPDAVEKRRVPCRLPSCAVQAFKNLQKVQLAYAERLENLELMVGQMLNADPHGGAH